LILRYMSIPLRNFDWLPFTPLWSPSPVLRLVSESVWSLAGFNRLYDLKAIWRKIHDVWLKLCNTYEGSSEIKSSRRDTYNRQYQTFSQKPGESIDDYFARFESIVSILHSFVSLAYSDNERAKQLLYVLDDSIWGMKITDLEKSADFGTLDTEKLFSKLKSHELSRKCRPNHNVSFSSKALITNAELVAMWLTPPTLLTHLL
jgi:hypothetical protein